MIAVPINMWNTIDDNPDFMAMGFFDQLLEFFLTAEILVDIDKAHR